MQHSQLSGMLTSILVRWEPPAWRPSSVTDGQLEDLDMSHKKCPSLRDQHHRQDRDVQSPALKLLVLFCFLLIKATYVRHSQDPHGPEVHPPIPPFTPHLHIYSAAHVQCLSYVATPAHTSIYSRADPGFRKHYFSLLPVWWIVPSGCHSFIPHIRM